MIRSAKVLSFCLLIALALGLSAAPARFMSYPTIHQDTVVFTWEGDLWRVVRTGGTAVRLTSFPGNEYGARISPDGRWIAFTASYDGQEQVYRMPIVGGEPERLTWEPWGAQSIGWSCDGQQVIFRTFRRITYQPVTQLFSVSPAGEYPSALPPPAAVLGSYSPDGRQLVYVPSGREEYYWKRYKGGQQQKLWRLDVKSGKYEVLTPDYDGKSTYPMFVGDDLIYASDRAGGIANLFRFDLASRKSEQLTRFTDFDVQTPATDGRRVVFTQAGLILSWDPVSGQTETLDIDIPSDRWALRERTVNPREWIQSFFPAVGGKAAVFEARGDVYLVPAGEGEPTLNLTATQGSRERFPQLSPDGKKVAFFSDRSGEYELFTCPATIRAPWTRLVTGLNTTPYHLEWSPDGSRILFGTKDFSIYVVEVATGKLTRIDHSNRLKNDEFVWEMSDYTWSPDSRWVAYSFVQENRNNRIFLYSLDSGKSTPITNDFYDCLNPTFDASGDTLYFLSYRNFTARMDLFEDNHVIPDPVRVMVVPLKGGKPPPFRKPRPAGEPKKEPFRIDLAGIESRTVALPVEPGNYFFLKAGREIVSWAEVDGISEDEYEEVFRPGGADKWTLHLYDLAAEKETVVAGKIGDWRISAGGETVLVRSGKKFFLAPLKELAQGGKLPGEELNLDHLTMVVSPVAEWTQIFNDTWRWYRDFFYDPGMHGRDWRKTGETYRAFIPQLSSRGQLNWLLSQMVGELCVSHTYVGGGDQGPVKLPERPRYVAAIGADLVPDASGYYRLARIFGPTPYDPDTAGPLVRPDWDIREGDFLLAIDGQPVKAPQNPYRCLQVVAGQKVELTIGHQPDPTKARTYLVEPLRGDYELHYNRWLADNIDRTLKESEGQVGYLHVTAMSSANVAQFDKFWRAFRYKKGLIIDVRGNGGGWTEYFLIDKLERQLVGFNNLKEMSPFRYPNSAGDGRYVVLTDENNGSDGEAFLEHFRARRLGTIIGVPSWGGLVGIINAQQTIDGGVVNQSNNAFYGREGKWWIENHGGDPDIRVENDPASVLAGRDPQLEKALEVVRRKIAETPNEFPPKPAYPKK